MICLGFLRKHGAEVRLLHVRALFMILVSLVGCWGSRSKIANGVTGVRSSYFSDVHVCRMQVSILSHGILWGLQ